VLEQNPEITTPDALPDTTQVSGRKTGNPVLGGALPLMQAPARKAARAIDFLFDSTMTAYIATSIHCLQAVPPICYLVDRKLRIQLMY